MSADILCRLQKQTENSDHCMWVRDLFQDAIDEIERLERLVESVSEAARQHQARAALHAERASESNS